MLTSVHSYAGARATAANWTSPVSCQDKCHQHQGDSFLPGHSHPEIYTRHEFKLPTQSTLQMGDFESSLHTIGDEPSQQQQQWTAELADIPKDCYYCRSSGDCPNDSPKYGKGKDYMDQTCNSCSGSGKCSHCGGDGVIG